MRFKDRRKLCVDHLRKDRFPSPRKNKLMLRVVSPFEILAKYGDNAFKIDVLEKYGL